MAPDLMRQMAYDSRTHELFLFHHRIAAVDAGTDSPRDHLERCLEHIAALEGAVNAFDAMKSGACGGPGDDCAVFVAAAS